MLTTKWFWVWLTGKGCFWFSVNFLLLKASHSLASTYFGNSTIVLKLPLTSILLTKGLHRNSGLLFGPLLVGLALTVLFFLPPKLQFGWKDDLVSFVLEGIASCFIQVLVQSRSEHQEGPGRLELYLKLIKFIFAVKLWYRWKGVVKVESNSPVGG